MYDPDEKCKSMIATIKELCEQKNMTPHALAKEAGISTSTISYLINRKANPQIYTILILCNVLFFVVIVSCIFKRYNRVWGGGNDV